ncbi:MAG: hypothetical protein ACOC9Q_00665 [bacterium]
MRRPLLIHVGYHKTATTWLQKVLFTPEHGYRKLLSHAEVFETLVRPHGLTFDGSSAKALMAERMAFETKCNVDVISSEILSGNPFLGGRESDQFARRLHAVAPDALILISIREQFSMMTSLYMQYVSRGGTMSPAAFFAESPDIGYVSFASEHLEFHRLIGLYRWLFGPGQVLVITKEGLDDDCRATLDRIGRFSGNHTPICLSGAAAQRLGASYPEYSSVALRRINHFRAGPLNSAPLIDLGAFSGTLYRATGALARSRPMTRLCGRRRPVATYVGKRFRGRFAHSNRALKAMLGDRIDLTGYETDE